MTADNGDLRALIREVIRDQLAALGPAGTAETVTLATDEDLAAFVTRLLTLDAAERDEILAGRKHFRLACPARPAPSMPAAPPSMPGAGVRRVERGAVTEATVRAAARAGERLVLGPRAVLTPLARDRARASGVQIDREP